MKNSFFLLLLLVCSCNYFKPQKKPQAVARVGKNYLYKSDIATLVPAGTSKQDSSLLVRDFTDRWASQKLLIEAAEKNLSDVKKTAYNALIKQYKVDLYTSAYIEEVIKNTVDTIVSEPELKKYYNENKENFKTNGSLVRLRFINLSKNNPRFETIKSKFFNYTKSDKNFWKTYALQSKIFAMNDTVWVDMSQVYLKLPFITPDNRDVFIVAGKRIEKEVKNDVYLVKITNVIDKNQISPYDYIKPTLKEVLLNRRKLELIKKFEKDIINDAIKNNDYEIYK